LNNKNKKRFLNPNALTLAAAKRTEAKQEIQMPKKPQASTRNSKRINSAFALRYPALTRPTRPFPCLLACCICIIAPIIPISEDWSSNKKEKERGNGREQNEKRKEK
jgi:hypothetical protein